MRDHISAAGCIRAARGYDTSHEEMVIQMVRMDIQTVVVGGGPVTSLVVLRSHAGDDAEAAQLPIRIGRVEASAISMGIDHKDQTRPLTHDLLASAISGLGGRVAQVRINDVRGTTFYAQIVLREQAGRSVILDARPSDAIALAVRTNAPIYASERVIEQASMPNFGEVERDEKQEELKEFHDFVEHVSPEDFGRPSDRGEQRP